MLGPCLNRGTELCRRIAEKMKPKLRSFVQNQNKAEKLGVKLPSCCSCSGSTKVPDARAALKKRRLKKPVENIR